MIELVVFDMAGTTVYDGDAVNTSFRAALAARGLDAEPAVVNSVMGLPKPEAIRILLEHCGNRPGVSNPMPATTENINAIHDDLTRRMCDYYASDPAVREIPGASEVFATLRRARIKIALNTGFFRPIVNVLLNRLGWRTPDVIDAVVTSDEVPRGRPHPDMIRHLMSRFGIVDARHVAKVGDTKADLEEGASAGCGVNIGVTSGSYTREQLQQYPHTHIVASVADVPEIILSFSPPLNY